MESVVNTDGVLLDLNRPKETAEADMDSCGAGDGGLDTKRTFSETESLSDDAGFNDTGDCLDEDGEDEMVDGKKRDPILDKIKETIDRCHSSAKSNASSSEGSDALPHVKVSNKFVSLPYGLVPWASYEHGKRSGDIMGVTYNGRMRQFIILDSKGITTWKRDAVEQRVSRDLHYPKYEYRLITNVIYAKKHNCYFVLGKDFSLKVYNRDFYETCSVSADLRSVLFMLFNPVRDELITGGVGGTKVWTFHQQSGKPPTMLRPLANYGLTLKYELPSVGGSWVKRVELDHHLEHLYCCSDTDLHVYNLTGKLLFKFERAHNMSITGCRYSQAASVLVTSSIDCEVKVWSLMGGLVHTFRGHSRAVTNLILHPATSSIVLTCSLDGTVRMWSLDTMDCIYSLVVSIDGLLWMGLTDDNMLFISTARAVTLWHMNYTVQFWALARSRVTHMELCGSKDKTTRLMAVSEDSSVRLMARSNHKNLCTVLPPPSISPLQRVLSVCYSREFNTIYMLINPHEIWVYTTRTDPACRIAVWDVIEIQASLLTNRNNPSNTDDFKPESISVNKPAPSHRATESGQGNEPVVNCCCLTILNSTAIVWTDEGCCCPIRDSYLLLGLEDGRILFMDPVKKGHKYLEFKTGKDPVLDMYHDQVHQSLVTVYKLTGLIQIQVWGLPDLELQHEVYTTPDLRRHARLGYTLVTTHESGSVIFHSLEHATDPGLHKPKVPPMLEEIIDTNHKPQHLAPVIALDVCIPVGIFCSCSKDGAVKIWSEDGTLMTEIMLDESVTSACFLNNMGDMVVGFQKQIFYIDHSKVCSQLTVPESDVDSFDRESFICEDPAVMYEGVSPNPDPVTLDNYLVPFDIEFSKDFLEGKVNLEPEPVQEEASDDESIHSQAATETYLSPAATPQRRLSLVDLTLRSEVSKYELLQHMKKTLDHLARRDYERRRRRMLRKGVVMEDEPDTSKTKQGNDEDQTDGHVTEKFLFPTFGESPGPSPRSTPAGTPEVLSDTEDDKDLSIHGPVTAATVQVVKVEEENDEISKFLAAEKDKPKMDDIMSIEKSGTKPKRKFGFSGVSVDAKSLMKDGKKASTPRDQGKQSLSPRKEVDSDSDQGERKPKRSQKEKKKKLPVQPKRKPEKDIPDPREPPPTQMQAMELRESKHDTSNDKLDGKQTSSSVGKSPTPSPSPKRKEVKPQVETGQSDESKKDIEADSYANKTSEQHAIASDSIGQENATNRQRKSLSSAKSTKSTEQISGEILHQQTPKQDVEDKTKVASVSSEDQALETSNTPVSTHLGPSATASVASIAGDKWVPGSGQESVAGTQVSGAVSSLGTRPATVDDAHMSDTEGRKSALSLAGSEDSKVAFRLGLLGKEPFDELNASEGGLSPTPAPDSGWTDQDIISVSRQRVRTAEHMGSSDVDETSDFVSGRPDAFSFVAQDQTNESAIKEAQQAKVYERPNTAAEDRVLQRPELQSAVNFFKQRPHTAQMRVRTEDLQTAFDTSLVKYKKLSRVPLASDTLHRNTDQAFTQHWHERQVERHMLIRMQKELRAQNAEKRREALKACRQDQLKKRLDAQEMQTMERRFHPHTPHTGGAPQQRASTVHGSRPTWSGPLPTPVSSRPQTAMAGDGRHVVPSGQQNFYQHTPSIEQYHNLHQYANHQRDAEKELEIAANQRIKSELSHQQPFRFKMRSNEAEVLPMSAFDPGEQINPWLLDPRNPSGIRPKSSKSIPSKCHRYVLITKPKAQLHLPLPTPLEEQLLAKRFPQQGEQVFKRYEGLLFRPHRRPEYGFDYSPFEHQLYG